MPNFSELSKQRLSTCHPNLQLLFNEVIKEFDCAILVGFRGKEDQEKAFSERTSQEHWPNSKHNTTPSIAVDVAPWPIDWGNKKRFYYFAGYVMGTAIRLGIPLRWGGDWDGDKDLDDQTLYDLVHFEIKGKV